MILTTTCNERCNKKLMEAQDLIKSEANDKKLAQKEINHIRHVDVPHMHVSDSDVSITASNIGGRIGCRSDGKELSFDVPMKREADGNGLHSF